jgi:glutamate dehydrogenase/leucine dehydrogenase
MTCKSAVAGLDLGGGKAVIIGDPQQDKSKIYDHVTTVFAAAERNGITPHRAAAVVAEERIASRETLNSKRRSVRSEP